MKEIAENKQIVCCSTFGRAKITKLSILTKVMYIFNITPIKMPNVFSIKNRKKKTKIVLNHKMP